MPIECPSCGASYRIPPSSRARRLRCSQCGETFVAPASREPAPAGTTPEPARLADDTPQRSPLVLVAAWIAILLGVTSVPLAILAFGAIGDLGASPRAPLTSSSGGLPSLAYTQLLMFGLPALAGLGLLVGGVGLLLRRWWGWWACFWSIVVALLNALRIALPLLGHLDWENERAAAAATRIVLVTGAPVVLGAVLLALLCLPGVREQRRAPRSRRRRGRARARA